MHTWIRNKGPAGPHGVCQGLALKASRLVLGIEAGNNEKGGASASTIIRTKHDATMMIKVKPKSMAGLASGSQEK